VIEKVLAADSSTHPSQERKLKVAYIMSRFPKLTETFILYEMLAMEEQGVQVEIYPLLRERAQIMHPEARAFVERAHFQPFISLPILRAHLHFWRRTPRAYLSTLWALLRGTWGSFRFFAGGLGIFPKVVYFAYLMATEGVTHVHAHFASHPAAAAFIIRRLVGIPYSFTAHGSDIHRDRHMLREKVSEAAFVVPISSFNRQVILEACGGAAAEKLVSNKLIVIHCGVDTRLFHPRPVHPLDNGSKLPAVPFSLLCIGTLHEVKGQTHLIEACRLLRERGVELTCHFVGDGPDKTALVEQATAAGLAPFVHFYGQQTRDEVARLLQATQVVVAPSVPSRDGRREGIPVVLMEAMASAVPVVSSRLSGIPELVEDGQDGLLTPPGDTAALADVLEQLYRDPGLRYRLGQAGREKVKREFDLYRNAAALARHFGREISS
jgi:glycosyltransferase involved in cell wall biosynthesis